MAQKFKNKYRIPSARMQNWDYGSNGMYFITICTKNRELFFGNIESAKMELNDVGELAERFWLEIPEHFPFVELGRFVIMPNHTHGILIINKIMPENKIYDANEHARMTNCGDLQTLKRLDVETLQCNVSTANAFPEKNRKMAKISPEGGSVSTIIRSYKSVVSKHAKLIRSDFAWQPRFHDHIIRDVQAFHRIQNYITNNPSNWESNKFRNVRIKK